jgi:hypothetical protein
MTARRRVATGALLILLILAVGSAHAEATTRETLPLTLSGAANAVLPSIGVDLSYQLADRLGAGAQLTSLLWAHLDLSLRTRIMVVAEPTWGLYLGANLHGWYSPLIIKGVSPLATGEVGYEYRGETGTTVGIGAGAGAIYIFEGEGRRNRIEPVVIANLRIGRSW